MFYIAKLKKYERSGYECGSLKIVITVNGAEKLEVERIIDKPQANLKIYYRVQFMIEP